MKKLHSLIGQTEQNFLANWQLLIQMANANLVASKTNTGANDQMLIVEDPETGRRMIVKPQTKTRIPLDVTFVKRNTVTDQDRDFHNISIELLPHPISVPNANYTKSMCYSSIMLRSYFDIHGLKAGMINLARTAQQTKILNHAAPRNVWMPCIKIDMPIKDGAVRKHKK